MLVTFKRDGDRYIVFGRDTDGSSERIGFLRRDGKRWNAVDTFMDKTRDFQTKAAAVEWLKTLPTT